MAKSFFPSRKDLFLCRYEDHVGISKSKQTYIEAWKQNNNQGMFFFIRRSTGL